MGSKSGLLLVHNSQIKGGKIDTCTGYWYEYDALMFGAIMNVNVESGVYGRTRSGDREGERDLFSHQIHPPPTKLVFQRLKNN